MKVTKCDDSRKWYSEFVGKNVPFLALDGKEWKSREPAGYINFIAEEDAELVEVEHDVWWKLANEWANGHS